MTVIDILPHKGVASGREPARVNRTCVTLAVHMTGI